MESLDVFLIMDMLHVLLQNNMPLDIKIENYACTPGGPRNMTYAKSLQTYWVRKRCQQRVPEEIPFVGHLYDRLGCGTGVLDLAVDLPRGGSLGCTI
jgi:hypothetical protein